MEVVLGQPQAKQIADSVGLWLDRLKELGPGPCYGTNFQPVGFQFGMGLK